MKNKHLDIFLILISVLGLLLIVNSVLIGGLNKDISESIAEAKELARPADIELTVLTNQQCVKCSDVKATVDSIKTNNNVKSENTIDFRLPEAQGFINDYGIEKIPSIVVKGELEKAKLSGFETREDAMVLKDTPAPYTGALDGEIKGLVELTYVMDSECEACFDLTNSIQQLKQGVVVDSEKVVEFDSDEGKSLVDKYGIEKIPTIVLSQDFSFYPQAEAWPQLGTIEDGDYVMRTINPPFINTTTSKVIGLVEVTYLTDDSCTDCYDVTAHKRILLRYGINPVKEETFDVSSSEGEALVGKYDITKAPTVILSGGASYYPTLNRVWQQVGSIADDGSYIFINVDVMGKYMDLTTGQIVG